MVDRIDKLKPHEAWKIQETNPSKQDKRNQSDEEKQQDAKSSFEEKVDFSKLISRENVGGSNLFTRNVKDISLKHAAIKKEEAETFASPLLKENKIGFQKGRGKNKTEQILMIVAGILLLVLIILIIRLFITI